MTGELLLTPEMARKADRFDRARLARKASGKARAIQLQAARERLERGMA